ncbi:DMT family transporter [uncultured Cohaesibacter sp.]|uniref:DMT family transporter n=1 Tax=uncultured Cohaesibacter sp. TaxID=1002546 RepID=UPI0029C96C92|nr:DMT family transporter [uncultured Cohaesibacter sp.]
MNSLAGIGLKLLSTVFFAVMIAMIKYVSETVPTGEVVFSRCFFAIIPLVIVAMIQGNWRDCIRTKQPWLHVRRSIVGAFGMFCWFAAVGMLPLPEATAISFLSPLMVVALAAIFLKETVRVYRWSAVGVGFVGVMIILSPRFSQSSGDVQVLGAVLAVISTLFTAMAGILIRHMTQSEKNAAIIFYFFAATSIYSLATLFWGWVLPEWDVMLFLVLAGIFGGLGQIAMTQAFRLTEASLLAPFDYVNMIWAVIIGMILFDEYPSMTVIVGGSIVTLAGLFVVYREHQLGLARKAERRVQRI